MAPVAAFVPQPTECGEPLHPTLVSSLPRLAANWTRGQPALPWALCQPLMGQVEGGQRDLGFSLSSVPPSCVIPGK